MSLDVSLYYLEPNETRVISAYNVFRSAMSELIAVLESEPRREDLDDLKEQLVRLGYIIPDVFTNHHQQIVFSANITNNLTGMAHAAGIYEACWDPDSIGAKQAKDIAPLLERGIALMRSEPERFDAFNATNGWGTRAGFIPWLVRYLGACREYPDAFVGADS